MALISARTIITSIALFHITLGFFFITSPVTVADQDLVWALGEATGMPHSRNFETQSPALAFLGVVLATIGISELCTLSLPEEICLVHFWGTQAPLRFSISLVLMIYTLAFGPSSPLSSQPHPGRAAYASWGGDALKNRVFLTFIATELIAWFWAYVTLREEREQVLARKAMKRRNSR